MSEAIMNARMARKVMFKSGCAGVMSQIINREFGEEKKAEELATGPLCGGMMQQGRQCGMLWGTSLGIGAEAHRSTSSIDEAIGAGITATRHMMESFKKQAGTLHCSEITGCNQSRPTGVARYLLTGGPRKCNTLLARWAPEAISSSREGLKLVPVEYTRKPLSCASLTLKQMGATEEEQAMVAGFAGGMGLSGEVCGAMAAAAWYITLPRVRKGNSTFFNSDAKRIFKTFKKESGGKLLCREICGRNFTTIDEHSEFMQGGACASLISAIAKA